MGEFYTSPPIPVSQDGTEEQFVFPEVMELTVVDALSYQRQASYQRHAHPSEWYHYCRDCGGLGVVEFPDTIRLEPVGELWRERGWECPNCDGEVWWVKTELYDALFLRKVLTYYFPLEAFMKGGGRLYFRVVKHCLWCGEFIDCDEFETSHNLEWNCMLCESCVMHVSARIVGTLVETYGLPMRAAFDIVLFLWARGGAD